VGAMDLGNGAGGSVHPHSIFTTDIDGQARPATDLDWDIGADEYVAAAATTNTVRMII